MEGEYLVDILSDVFGEVKKHTPHKGQVAFDCPACAMDKGLSTTDGKGNLEVNYRKGVFRCWACSGKNNMKGRLKYLIKRYGNAHHVNQYNLVKPEFEYYDDNGDSVTVVHEELLPEEYFQLTESNSWQKGYDDALAYLTKRGIGPEIIKKHKIGYCNKGKFHHRIILPSYDENGSLNFFVGRTIWKKIKPKYLNSEAPREDVIFNRSLINPDATIYLVEGPFDSIVTPNSIPLLGLNIFDKLIDFLQENAKANVVVILDGEAKRDAIEVYKKLNTLKLKGRVRIIYLNIDYDMSLIYEKYGNKGLKAVLKNETIVPEIEY
jgi:DNA primase